MEVLGTRLRVGCENMSMWRRTAWVHRKDHVHVVCTWVHRKDRVHVVCTWVHRKDHVHVVCTWVHRKDHDHIACTCVREQVQSQLAQGYMYLRVVKLLHAIWQFLSDRLHQWRNYHWLLLVPEMVLAEDVVTVLLGESSGLNHTDLWVWVWVCRFKFLLF